MRSSFRVALLLVASLVGASCSAHYSYDTHSVREAWLADDYEGALQQLKPFRQDPKWDRLLVALDEGALAHAAGQTERSIRVLNEAAALAEQREIVSVSQEILGSAEYRLATHERQALHVLQSLNYLQQGDLENALVEARLTDLVQWKIKNEEAEQIRKERYIVGRSLTNGARAYLERLIAGRYIAGVVRELEGDAPGAFLDYLEALHIAQQAPPGAPIEDIAHELAQLLVRQARALNRPELGELEKLAPGTPVESGQPDTGEIVVLIERGWVPNREISNGGVSIVNVPSVEGDVTARTSGQTATAQPLTSLRHLLEVRGVHGLILDTERAPTVGVNAALFAAFLLVPPLGAPLLIRRGYESGVRTEQSWRTLPEVFAVARLRVPTGSQTVQVTLGQQHLEKNIVVKAHRPSVWVVRIPSRRDV